ncbi:uncharacterized protein G2W53_013969 [Senna tora]|uniref:Uncharacterized protein n=1 Tax=Senna tora TaxID=362788 RepID=A0A834WSE0_9FABA|nr:uncharacterized protein G2W53_013969 [Senna tora]
MYLSKDPLGESILGRIGFLSKCESSKKRRLDEEQQNSSPS